MVSFYPESEQYDYGEYTIVNDTQSGMWLLLDSDEQLLGHFSTSKEAEEFVSATDEETMIEDELSDDTNVVATFIDETGLRLRKYSENRYVEISGQSYRNIAARVRRYNKDHGTDITCYDDTTRDATFIMF